MPAHIRFQAHQLPTSLSGGGVVAVPDEGRIRVCAGRSRSRLRDARPAAAPTLWIKELVLPKASQPGTEQSVFHGKVAEGLPRTSGMSASFIRFSFAHLVRLQ
jgi:hypothetical protein